jgi:hypothetical protein
MISHSWQNLVFTHEVLFIESLTDREKTARPTVRLGPEKWLWATKNQRIPFSGDYGVTRFVISCSPVQVSLKPTVGRTGTPPGNRRNSQQTVRLWVSTGPGGCLFARERPVTPHFGAVYGDFSPPLRVNIWYIRAFNCHFPKL